ncbi:MAG: serine/threonine-protein kinase [Sedimentisphaerales bacterium]|nr:serine/threonine-protein kinase [Sedimentisphaerales bacterium]
MTEENHFPQCGAELPADTPQGQCPQCLMKLGLPTGAEVDKQEDSKSASDVFTGVTPPGGFIPPEPSGLASQFPQLEIIELLGQGGMGAVYKARQKQLDRLVALKILPPEVGRTEAFAERFTREARSLAKLSHPRIVSVHDFGHTEDGLYYFIMEFIDGTDLRRVIQAGSLSATEALAIVPQICEALQFAHEEGIVHRDIKPENILLDKRGRVKIADFGLAKLLDKPAAVYTLTQAGQRMGTPHYMAPEQIEHPGQVDHRADIYSLGVVFYEMLTGELPLGRFAPPSQKVHVDVRLDKVVLHSLEKEPERRYQHASEVKSDVEIISAEPNTPIQYPPRATAPVQPRFSRAAILGACWAISFLLLPLLAVLYITPVHRVTVTNPADARGIPILGLVLVGLPLLLALSSVFGTTILGLVAISHIRHSAGRLYGMGLALFDALLFPLLLLDAAIIACFWLMFRIPIVLPLPGVFKLGFALLLAGAICIVIDFFIVRMAWRQANRGLVPVQPDGTFTATGAIPETTGKQQQYHNMQTGVNTGAAAAWPPGGPAQSGAAAGGFAQNNPMEKHVTIVAMLNIVFGFIAIVIGIIALAAISGGGLISRDPTAMKVTGIVGPAVGFFFFLTSAPGVIAGIGLLKRRGWARILTIILAIFGLMNIPIGTAIGIYTLWVLMNDKTAQLFAQASAERMK